ncbi:hypothetical protein RA20_23410 [Leisingera sp. ANG-Vp]|nr:hypothetical protein RA20_23410 [Leisingera sp. ANG-Vp]
MVPAAAQSPVPASGSGSQTAGSCSRAARRSHEFSNAATADCGEHGSRPVTRFTGPQVAEPAAGRRRPAARRGSAAEGEPLRKTGKKIAALHCAARRHEFH